jgi:adenylate kinase
MLFRKSTHYFQRNILRLSRPNMLLLSLLLFLLPLSIFGLHDGSSPRIWGSRPRLAFSAKKSHGSNLEGIEVQLQDKLKVEVLDIPALIGAASPEILETVSQEAVGEYSRPPRIIIIGGPASGKGTQCENIASKYGVVHLSTGDMLREAVKEGSAIGRIAKEYMDRGELVPDEVIIQIVSARLYQDDCKERGWLLDGFPRTKAQAEHLTRMGVNADITILLDVSDVDMVERVIGRRTDPVTGKIYHLKFRPPPAEVMNRLEQRSDDTVEKIKRRLEQFHENVSQIASYLDDSIVEIDGSGAPDKIARSIAKEIDHRVRRRIQV